MNLDKKKIRSFQRAIKKDYGINIPYDEAYTASNNLIELVLLLSDNIQGSKVVQNNPLFKDR